MTLQEVLKSVDNLSIADQVLLLEQLKKRFAQKNINNTNQENFWEMTLRSREQMEREEIVFTDEDFANLRDRSPGREVDF
ncbi:MAG TPA: hypothetical protein V6D21_16865 [Candidatus Obscuribacterales bacterium]